jgi:methionine-gamma-lyase
MPHLTPEDMAARRFAPETLMMSYGYKPELSEGALKCPIFQTSTFVFKRAEEGKAFFQVAYGQRERGPSEELGLIYSRLNNPDLEILENRLALWDGADDAAVFESGIAAISTVLLEFLKPGEVLLHSRPLYGGTHHLIQSVLTRFGIETVAFDHEDCEDEIMARLRDRGHEGKVALIYVETPANPTNDQIDLEMMARLASRLSTSERAVVTAVDNTYMGPMWQRPLTFGVDLICYSATKFIGGHSDLIAGSVSGRRDLIARVKTLRTFFGNMAGPWTGWLLMRSLETLKVRTDAMAANAAKVAEFLRGHPKVERVYYCGFFPEGSRQAEIFSRQCDSAGSMISFDVRGGEAEAFRFLDALKIVRLAVSLGGTESLAEHPASMTHVDVCPEERAELGITDRMVRLSVGIENVDDLIWDLTQALQAV